jgi:hypothetical protein
MQKDSTALPDRGMLLRIAGVHLSQADGLTG